MTTVQILSTIAAVAVVAGPWLKQALLSIRLPSFKPQALAKRPVGYEAAIHDLAVVRSRLAATAQLGEDQKKAIDTLTLALVAGSDQ